MNANSKERLGDPIFSRQGRKVGEGRLQAKELAQEFSSVSTPDGIYALAVVIQIIRPRPLAVRRFSFVQF